MSNRYNLAKAFGNDHFERVLKEDADLLLYHGMRLLSVDSGVSVAKVSELYGRTIHPWQTRVMSHSTWEWVRPLLERLRDLEENTKGVSPKPNPQVIQISAK